MKPIDLNEKTKASFLKTVNSDTPTIILYHASWCGHCQAFQPTWAAVKAQLSKETGISVVEVEHTHMNHLPASIAQVTGFPTIMILRSGKPVSEYAGDRSLADVVSFAKKHASKDKAKAKPKPKPSAKPNDKKQKALKK